MSSFNQSSKTNMKNNTNSKLNNLHTIVDELATGLKTQLGGLLSELLNRSDDLDETNRIILTLPVVKNALSSTFARIEQSILDNNVYAHCPDDLSSDEHLQPIATNQTCTFNYESLTNHVPPLELEQDDQPVVEASDKQEVAEDQVAAEDEEDEEAAEDQVAIEDEEDEEAAEDQVAIEDEEVDEEAEEDEEAAEDQVAIEDEEVEEVMEEPVNISLKIEEIEEESPDDVEEAEEDDDEGDEVEESGEEEEEALVNVEESEEVVADDAEESEEVVADAEESDEEVNTDDDVVEEEEAVSDADAEAEEDEEVFEIDIMGKTYFTNNATSGDIYEMDSAGDPGDEVGKFVKGVAKFN